MITVDVAAIEAQILSRDREARGHLASVLLHSLDDDETYTRLSEEELEQLWDVELERRSKEWDEDPSIGIPHEDVVRRARELLK